MDLRYVVTTGCNADCFFCLNEYIGSKSRQYITSPQDYGNLSRTAVKLGSEGVTITGGEPTLREDLEQIISNIKGAGSNVTVVSNGYKLKRHMNAWGNVDKLHVSYHTFDEAEWERITKFKGGPSLVAENLIAVRKDHPYLAIRLNVVSTEENSNGESLKKYLDLAQKVGANISVFQNGYLKLLKEIGRLPIGSESPIDFWDLKSMGGILVQDTPRIKTYGFGDVQIHLTYLSSEMHNGGSIWITPMNEGFSDIRKRSRLVNFNPSLQARNFDKIEKSLISLSKEAELLKVMEQKGIKPEDSTEYNCLVQEREETLDTTENKYFF